MTPEEQNKLIIPTSAPTRQVVPAFAPEPFACGATYAAERSGWRRLIPPGFRTGKGWKITTAFIWYFFSIGLFFTMLTDSSYDRLLERYMISLWSLSITLGLPFFLCNYLDIWQKLHIDRIHSILMRYFAALLWYLVTVFLYGGILTLFIVLTSR